MSTAQEEIRTAVDLTAPTEPAEQAEPQGRWVRAVGNYARCDNRRCTTRVRGSIVLFKTIHGSGPRAYATQLCVPCKLQEIAEECALRGELPEVDPPPKGAKGKPVVVPDPDWNDAATRKPVSGVLLNKQQFDQCNVVAMRMLNEQTSGVEQPDERGVELVSVDKRKARERSKAKPATKDELSGNRAGIGG